MPSNPMTLNLFFPTATSVLDLPHYLHKSDPTGFLYKRPLYWWMKYNMCCGLNKPGLCSRSAIKKDYESYKTCCSQTGDVEVPGIALTRAIRFARGRLQIIFCLEVVQVFTKPIWSLQACVLESSHCNAIMINLNPCRVWRSSDQGNHNDSCHAQIKTLERPGESSSRLEWKLLTLKKKDAEGMGQTCSKLLFQLTAHPYIILAWYRLGVYKFVHKPFGIAFCGSPIVGNIQMLSMFRTSLQMFSWANRKANMQFCLKPEFSTLMYE